MQKEIETLIEAIKASYGEWQTRNSNDEIREKMIAEFNEKISFTVGKKFAKIVTGGSVWGFIALFDDGKFKRGDILKAATWSQPAKNFARGNILKGGYKIFWAGAQ
jgi:hypothetical protein